MLTNLMKCALESRVARTQALEAARSLVMQPLFARFVQFAVVSFGLLHFVLAWIGYPGEPIIWPDSSTYRSWSQLIPIGYPAFLSVVPLHAVPMVQFGIYIAAVLTLFFCLWRISAVAACVSAVALLSFSVAWYYAMAVLSESLAISLIVLHVAAVAAALYRPSPLALLSIGATVGLSALIRPAFYFLFISLMLVPIFCPGRRRLSAIFIASSAFIIFLSGCAFSYVTRGVATQTLGGITMYGHVAHLFDPAQSKLPEETKAVAIAIRDHLRQKRDAAKSIGERQMIEVEEFNSSVHQFAAGTKSWNTTVFAQISREAILANPIGYISTVFDNIFAAYALHSFAENGAASQALMEKLLKKDASPVLNVLGRLQVIPGLLHRKLVILLFAASIVFLIFMSRDAVIARVGLYAAILHFTGISFMSVATVIIPRYATAVDALVLITGACVISCLLNVVVKLGGQQTHAVIGNDPQHTAVSVD